MRLIDADVLERVIETDMSGQSYDAYLIAKQAVANAPTVDAVPVVRGEWELYGNDDDSGMSYWCTACNFNLSDDLFYSGYKNGKWIENRVFKYCPNCGAKMDGERRNDDG